MYTSCKLVLCESLPESAGFGSLGWDKQGQLYHEYKATIAGSGVCDRMDPTVSLPFDLQELMKYKQATEKALKEQERKARVTGAMQLPSDKSKGRGHSSALQGDGEHSRASSSSKGLSARKHPWCFHTAKSNWSCLYDWEKPSGRQRANSLRKRHLRHFVSLCTLYILYISEYENLTACLQFIYFVLQYRLTLCWHSVAYNTGQLLCFSHLFLQVTCLKPGCFQVLGQTSCEFNTLPWVVHKCTAILYSDSTVGHHGPVL